MRYNTLKKEKESKINIICEVNEKEIKMKTQNFIFL